MPKIIHAAVLVITTIVLAGCSPSDVSDALDRANAASSPEDAWRIIRKARTDYRESHPLFDLPEKFDRAEDMYFAAAARAGSGLVLQSLFRRHDNDALKNELKVSVLDAAKTSADPNLLMAAAFIYGNDSLGLINSAQQLATFERAWNAGDKHAAGYLAHLFVRMKDYERAYYWSLRCTPPCDREYTVGIGRNGQDDHYQQTDLSKLEKHLSRGVIAKHQEQAAADVLAKYQKQAAAVAAKK